ncbi:MAG: TIGR04442 family protein [Deltaproteobacteria bacterium]|nr:TIGR04442 family protein [Deltaproteobacteria bacterium]
MIQEMTFHGKVNETVEYFATIAGKALMHRHFYEQQDNGSDRFFYAGNEIILDKNGVRHRGNGGSFCKYMFGVEQPIKDLVRKDVLNRLAMYGVGFDKDKAHLKFTNETDGSINFDSMFMDGNAVTNYYFFISVDIPGDIKAKQEELLRLIGKTLKYTPSIGREDDMSLISELTADLDGYNPVVFLFRIVNRVNKRFCDFFKELYFEKRIITEDDDRVLNSFAAEFGIDQYQQERIKIDVMYNHRDNKRVVDEYKDILISFESMAEIAAKDLAALNRLRALAIKNNIPHYLFDALDEMLLKDKALAAQHDEPEFVRETRALLEGLFMMEGGLDAVISKDDVVKLLVNKKAAMASRDQSFDGLMLDAGRMCDEKFKAGNVTAFERFSELITYFDRFDTTSSMINHMSFMDDDVSVEKLRSLLGNKKSFEELSPGLYNKLFIDDLLRDPYLLGAGRRKINAITTGLKEVENGYKSLNDVATEIAKINEENKMVQVLYKTAKDRLDKVPSFMEIDVKEQDGFLKEALKSLLKDGPISKIPKNVMMKVFTTLKMEIFYLNEVLPKLIVSFDTKIREDFIENSGFDRFFIEDIERSYIERHELPGESVRKFKELIGQAEAVEAGEGL